MTIRVHRIVLSIVDFEGMSKEDIAVEFENMRHIYPSIKDHQVRHVTDDHLNGWSDDHPLNQHDANLAEFDAKFYACDEVVE